MSVRRIQVTAKSGNLGAAGRDEPVRHRLGLSLLEDGHEVEATVPVPDGVEGIRQVLDCVRPQNHGGQSGSQINLRVEEPDGLCELPCWLKFTTA